MTPTAASQLAFGRILRLASRPYRPGDRDEYERCRAIILDELDPLNQARPDYRPDHTRDRLKGAQGD